MIGKKLAQAAQKEAVLERPFPQVAQASVQSGKTQIRARVEVADADRFSKMAQKISVSTDRANRASVEEKAQNFAEKTTYLSENLGYVETDIGGAAIVRSTPQTMAGRGAPYFEAKISETEVTLERFQSKTEGGRENIPFCVTDDILARVTDDAASVLTPKK